MPNNESVDIFVPVDDILERIDRSTLATLSLADCEAARRSYEALCNGTAKPERKRRERKPSVATLIKRAEKAGKTVTAITTPDGVTLTFGEAKENDANSGTNVNPWDEVLNAADQKRPS
jgi:hypothetical protein